MQEEQKNTEQQLETAPEQKKKSRLLMIGLAAAVVAVIGIGAFAALQLFAKNPKTVVAQAFLSLGADLDQAPAEQIFGFREISENKLTGDYEENFDLSISTISDEEMALLEGSGLSLSQRLSNTQKKSWGSLGLNYGSMALGTLEAYYDEEMLQAALPDYSSKVFLINLGEGLEEEILNAPVMDLAGVPQEEKAQMAHSLASALNSPFGETVTAGELWDRFRESGQAVTDFVEGVQVEKAGKETFQMDGKDVKCTGYEVIIGRDILVDFIKSYMDFIWNDEEVKELILNQVGASLELYAQNGGGAEEGYDQMVQDVQEAVDQVCSALTDVHMMVYVDGDGRMAAWDLETALNSEGEEVSLALNLRPQGGTYLTQNMTASIQIEGGGDTISADLEKAGSYENGTMEESGKLTFSADGEEASMNWLIAYDSEGETWDASLGLGTSDAPEMFTAQAHGIVDELEKGTRISASMDELSLQATGQEIKLEGSYSYQKTEEAPASLEGDQLNVFTATEEEWQSVIDEMSEKFQGILLTLMFQGGVQ